VAEGGESFEVKEHTLERQCDYEYIDSIRAIAANTT